MARVLSFAQALISYGRLRTGGQVLAPNSINSDVTHLFPCSILLLYLVVLRPLFTSLGVHITHCSHHSAFASPIVHVTHCSHHPSFTSLSVHITHRSRHPSFTSLSVRITHRSRHSAFTSPIVHVTHRFITHRSHHSPVSS